MENVMTIGAGAAAGFGMASAMDMPFEVAAIMAGLMAFGGYVVKNNMGTTPTDSPAPKHEAKEVRRTEPVRQQPKKASKSKKRSKKKRSSKKKKAEPVVAVEVAVEVAKEPEEVEAEPDMSSMSKKQRKRYKQKMAKKKLQEETERKEREEKEKKEREREEKARKEREEEQRRKKETEKEAAAKKKKKKKKKHKHQKKETGIPEVPTHAIEDDNDEEWIVQKNRGTKKQSRKNNKNDKDVKTEPSVPQGFGELQIPPKSFPRVIGTGGCNLKTIQAATQCQVSMPKKGSGNNWAVIKGPVDNIETVKLALTDLINKGYCELTHPGMTSTGVSVPQDKRAQVIGRKGAWLKAIRDATDVKIDMPDKDGESDKVQIRGSTEGCELAKRAIAELRDNGFSFLTHPDTMRIKFDFPFNKIKHIVGPKGSTIKAIQKNTNTRIDTPDVRGEPIYIMGPEQGCQQAKASIMAILAMPLEIEETLAGWATVDESLNEW